MKQAGRAFQEFIDAIHLADNESGLKRVATRLDDRPLRVLWHCPAILKGSFWQSGHSLKPLNRCELKPFGGSLGPSRLLTVLPENSATKSQRIG